MSNIAHNGTAFTTSVEVGGVTMSFETGRLAKQAGGAVLVRYGDSSVLVTAVTSHEPSRFDFLPLTVDYMDRNGASGTIPGGFLKREGRGSERETLISRLIDRPIRPMFPKTFRNEMQVIATVVSYDKNCETDVLAVCGASAALWVSDAPMSEPVAGVRIVKHGGAWHVNPNFQITAEAEAHLVVAGTRHAITMVEAGAKEASESDMLDALELAQKEIVRIVDAIEELHKLAGKPRMTVKPARPVPAEILDVVMAEGKAPLQKAMAIPGKHERKDGIKAARQVFIDRFTADKTDAAEITQITSDVKESWEKLIKKVMREQVLKDGTRLDGRQPDQIRSIWSEVGVSPRAHGSSIFTRGETQGLVTVALGTDDDNQLMDLPSGRVTRNFLLTYNFPPFCTGEASPLRAPKRREVGHGALARRGLEAVMPTKDKFPYVIRITSDILESNGSSSMATVCGGTLALMDAGVPIKAPVAGIAMGLIKEGDAFAVISDILGDEDALGDMDFKVTGTRNGITAFQMDTKISGVGREVMSKALEQARQGRVHILDEMAKAIGETRADLSPHAPRITTVQIKPDRIREIIGPGGKTIRGIQEACGVKISVDDSGKVDIASSDKTATDKAVAMIREITQEAEIGALYVGVVKRITDFGAFVEIFPGTDGLIHISHLAHERVNAVRDVVNEGDEVLVRVIDIDRAGKIRLSRKEALDAASGM